MVGETARAGDALLRIGDLAALTVAAFIALAVTQLVPGAAPLPPDPVAVYWPPFVFSLLLWLASAWLHQVYEARSGSPWVELARVTSATALVGTVAAAAFFLAKYQVASRLTVVVYYAAAWMLL